MSVPQPFPTSFTGKQKVSPATIQKIEALIKEVGYVQKRGLRVLNNEKSQLIAVVINYHKEFKDSILGDPFYGKIIGFIEEYVQKQGYYLMLYSTKDIEEIFQMVAGWDVDGVIAISFSRHNCEKIYQLIKNRSCRSMPTETQPKTAIWSISVWMTKVAAIRW